jgi:hypothetical protein
MRVVIDVRAEDLPAHTGEEFTEWIQYQVGMRASMSMGNPLVDYDLQCYSCDIEA